MKKIAIAFAVVAALLAFSCANPAGGPVDLAGNPVDLTGSWSGSVAYKYTMSVLPFSFIGLGGGQYYDMSGTWVKVVNTTKPTKDYSTVQTNVNAAGDFTTTTTTNYLFNAPTTKTTVTRVIESTGNYVETTVVEYVYTARAAIGAVNATGTATTSSETRYTVDNDGTITHYLPSGNTAIPAGGTVAIAYFNVYNSAWVLTGTAFEIPAYLGGTYSETTTKTITVTAQTDGLYTESTVQTYAIGKTGEKYTATKTNSPQTAGYTVETYPTVNRTNMKKSELTFQNIYGNSDWRHSIMSGLVPVQYQNDVTETVTFVVKEDGTYTLTTVVVETQAAADAAAATAVYYAAPARTAATWTTTTTSTGTVAAWETIGTANTAPVTKMVLSANSQRSEAVGTGAWLESAPDLPAVARMNAGEFEIRFFQGEGKKDQTIKTRMYVGLNSSVVILDKAAAAE